MVIAVRIDFLATLQGFVEGFVRGRFNREAILALLYQEALAAYGESTPSSHDLFEAIDLSLACLEKSERMVLSGDRSQPSLTVVRLR